MAESSQPPILIKPIPLIVAQEDVILGPIDFIEYIQPNSTTADLLFTATLDNDDPLPPGLFCTPDGFLTGIAEVGTLGNYDIILRVKGAASDSVMVNVFLTIEAATKTTFNETEVASAVIKETEVAPAVIEEIEVTPTVIEEAEVAPTAAVINLLAKPPVLVKPFPPLMTYEGAAFGPIDLWDYVATDADSGDMSFVAGLANGDGLPQGLICTSDGFISGIPAKGTQGAYDIVLEVKNAAQEALIAELTLTINTRPEIAEGTSLGDAKAQMWDALVHDLPIPDLATLLNRPITSTEIYYLLQRFAVLTIWDIYNLEPAGDKVLLKLSGASKHYNVYDRGSCLVAAPKDLFSYERTLEDALKTARAMAGEVYKRGWTIEFSGFNKMVRAAWVEVQILGDKHGKPLEVLHFEPTPEDVKLYAVQAQAREHEPPSPS